MERKLLFEDIVLFGGYFLSGERRSDKFGDIFTMYLVSKLRQKGYTY